MKNWRGYVSVIEVLIMLVCVIMLITHFAKKTNNNTKSENYAIEDINGNIDQSYALDYLNKYIDELLFSGYINESSESYVEKEYDYLTPNIFANLNNNDKLYLSLSYLTNANMPLTKKNVERKYNEYFNDTNIEHMDLDYCTSYKYDDLNETYTVENNCINNSLDKIMVYKQNYERNENIGKAHIYVGVKSPYAIYTDLDRSKMFETDNISEFTINEDNYKDFAEYEITFKEKDDSLYYFFSINKVN